MSSSQLSVEDCLHLLDEVDRGAIVSQRFSINGAPESRICFKGAHLEEINLQGRKIGVALPARMGGLLIRRGHAEGKKFVMNSTVKLNYYWITDLGRLAAKATNQA